LNFIFSLENDIMATSERCVLSLISLVHTNALSFPFVYTFSRLPN